MILRELTNSNNGIKAYDGSRLGLGLKRKERIEPNQIGKEHYLKP
jgi:hypothetical protein